MTGTALVDSFSKFFGSRSIGWASYSNGQNITLPNGEADQVHLLFQMHFEVDQPNASGYTISLQFSYKSSANLFVVSALFNADKDMTLLYIEDVDPSGFHRITNFQLPRDEQRAEKILKSFRKFTDLVHDFGHLQMDSPMPSRPKFTFSLIRSDYC